MLRKEMIVYTDKARGEYVFGAVEVDFARPVRFIPAVNDRLSFDGSSMVAMARERPKASLVQREVP